MAIKKENAIFKFHHDKESDSAYITISKGKIHETPEISENIFADITKKGKLIGIEILNASKNMDAPARSNSTHIGLAKKLIKEVRQEIKDGENQIIEWESNLGKFKGNSLNYTYALDEFAKKQIKILQHSLKLRRDMLDLIEELQKKIELNPV